MEIMNEMIVLAQTLGEIAMRHWGVIGASYKTDKSPVTLADTEINSEVIRVIKGWFPQDTILGEEESDLGSSSVVWVVDPLDGTRPFSVGMPNFTAPAIARTEGGVLTHAVVRCPTTNRTYWAENGKGSWLREGNGEPRRLRVSQKTDFKNTTVFAQCRKSSMFDAFSVAKSLTEAGANNLSTGSIIEEATYIARGDIALAEPAVAALYHVDKAYDVAAPALIVLEAGGMVTDFHGHPIVAYDKPMFGALFTNGLVHYELVKMTSQCALK